MSEAGSWEEIRRLAADFQRVQLGDTAKRLSDRNCVELIVKLRDLGLVDIIYSLDGKDFITKSYLTTQMKNETLGSKGRIALVQLQEILNVEYQHIEDRVNDILKSDDQFMLCVGELITKEYLSSVCEEVNSSLKETGKISLGEIARQYNLPSDFLKQHLFGGMLSNSVQGIRDKTNPDILYTERFVEQQKGLLRGSLSGLTVPQSVSRIVQSNPMLHSGLIFDCISELFKNKDVSGSISGGKIIDRAIFIPTMYTSRVRRWLEELYLQNGFVETAAARRLGWSEDISQFIPGDQSSYKVLSTCIISNDLWNQCISTIEDQVMKEGWAEVPAHLPDIVGTTDSAQLASQIVQKHKGEWQLCSDTYIYSNSLISTVLQLFVPEIEDRAAKLGPELAKRLKQVSKTEDSPTKHQSDGFDEPINLKKTGKRKGKGGAKKSDKVNSEPERKDNVGGSASVEFMKQDEIVSFLAENWSEDVPEEICEDIADNIKASLDSKFREKVESVFLDSEIASKGSTKKLHADFNSSFQSLLRNIYLFNIGADVFDDPVRGQLKALLLRTLCSDAINMAVSYMAGSDLDSSKLTPKVRDQIIGEMNPNAKSAFKALVNSLGQKDGLEPFFEAIEGICAGDVCAINVKYPDRKARNELLEAYRKDLVAKIEESSDSPEILLMVLLCLFSKLTGSMVHATGKFVPQLSTMVQKNLSDDEFSLLIAQVQDLVVKTLTKDKLKEEEKAQLVVDIDEKVASLKQRLRLVLASGN